MGDAIKDSGFSVDDRVTKANEPGPQGVVKSVRAETVTSQGENKSVMVQVLWDNGTLSYFAPEGLQKV